MRRLCPRRLGSFVQENAHRLLLLITLALLVLSAAINSFKLDLELASWIHRTSRIDHELQAIESVIGDGAGSNSLLILQTPKKNPRKNAHNNNNNNNQETDNVLTVESFMIHLEALAIATHVTIDLFDISWSLKDICFSPTLPDYEGMLVNQLLDHLMPCAIKTPLDCFWEGSKLLGPEQEVRLSSIGPKLKWTSLNPLLMMEAKRQAHPHATFPHDALISWMKRVGLTSGYQERPCLDPSDPNCPITAPNKLDGAAPNIGSQLTGGCKGLATNQMHWKEEEIVGGIQRNRSGHIVRADALQSTIQLLGERDVYDYWRKTSKVQDINNWSTDKAKLVLDTWQKRFNDELAQFTRTSITSSSYKIHALSPNSMLEPINSSTILDTANFKITVICMAIFMCIFYPNFEAKDNNNNNNNNNTAEETNSNNDDQDEVGVKVDSIRISRFKLFLMAAATSLITVLTFLASLGLSSFMNLPFNMATTQILPPLALYYGFRQALMVANIYSKHFKNVPPAELTTECLNELIPVVIIETAALVVPLATASILPVHATRVFIFQAIIYIVLASMTAILLVPALLITFLVHNSCEASDKSIIYITYTNKPARCISPGLLSIKSRKSVKDAESRAEPTIEEQIFSRLQQDLMDIRSDSRQPTDINFSIKADGSKTSLKLTTSRSVGNQSRGQTGGSSKSGLNQNPNQLSSDLPDLLLRPEMLQKHDTNTIVDVDDSKEPNDADECQKNKSNRLERYRRSLIKHSSDLITRRYFQILVCVFRLALFGLLISQAPKIRYGLQLRDIVTRNTNDYDSLSIREKYFPVYNVFAITKGDFDYPSNQRLLYEYQSRIEQVEGVVRDTTKQPKFWLMYFRDWLLELQEQFDSDRNKSAISTDGWTPEASEASKMAYKLMVQTGKIDNPIDRNLVETNRLVDRNGIINQRAFYYYLTAWVMNDAYTYSMSEANLKPEPKTWNENPNDLRIERARPLVYAQIPFLMKLPEDSNSLEAVIEIRAISQAFEQLGLPNFPTGIPFIFWDQFINLDLLFMIILLVIFMMLFAIFGIFTSNFSLAIIVTVPALVTSLELYSLTGYSSFHFNTIVAVLLINSIGMMVIQTIHCAVKFQTAYGDLGARLMVTMEHTGGFMMKSLSLLLLAACVFSNSKIDFMSKYSGLIFYLGLVNYLNSMILTPVLFALFGPEQHQIKQDILPKAVSNDYGNTKVARRDKAKTKHGKSLKKKQIPRFHSEISLSTISEEPPSVSPVICDFSYNEPYLR